jgi:hypothetical protein
MLIKGEKMTNTKKNKVLIISIIANVLLLGLIIGKGLGCDYNGGMRGHMSDHRMQHSSYNKGCDCKSGGKCTCEKGKCTCCDCKSGKSCTCEAGKCNCRECVIGKCNCKSGGKCTCEKGKCTCEAGRGECAHCTSSNGQHYEGSCNCEGGECASDYKSSKCACGKGYGKYNIMKKHAYNNLKIKEARANVEKALIAEPYNKKAVLKAFEELNEEMNEVKMKVYTEIADKAEKLKPEERLGLLPCGKCRNK